MRDPCVERESGAAILAEDDEESVSFGDLIDAYCVASVLPSSLRGLEPARQADYPHANEGTQNEGESVAQ